MIEAVKVKAHVVITEDMPVTKILQTEANSAADAAAKLGAQMHPQPSMGERAEAAADWDFWCCAAIYFSRMLAHWPTVAQRTGGARLMLKESMRGEAVGQRGRPRLKQIHVPSRPHRFARFGNSRLCEVCLLRVHSSKAERAAEQQECPGVATAIQEVLTKSASLWRSHSLVLFSCGGLPGLLCLTCGAVTTTRNKHLTLSCLGTRKARGQDALRRYKRGQHPDPKHLQYYGVDRIDAAWRVDDGGAIVEESCADGAERAAAAA